MKTYSIISVMVFLAAGCAQPQNPIRFTEMAREAGLADPGVNGAGVAFGDYDNDGDVDIYLSNADAATLAFGIHNRLWENDGQGHFVDVSEARGVANRRGPGSGRVVG